MNKETKEVKVQVATYRVKRNCSECDAELYCVYHYQTTTSDEVSGYLHECPKCKKRYMLDKVYPYITHEEMQ